MDAIKDGEKIFTEIANSVNWTETNNISEASELLKKLIEATKGIVLVDFLDSKNWDGIAGVECIEDSLFIHSHDSRNVLEEKQKKEMRMLGVVLPSLISSLMKFKELKIVQTRNFPVFLLRGYALKDKEIKTILNNGFSTLKILDNKGNFSKLVIRRKDDVSEKYTCLNTSLLSMIIIPQNLNISVYPSKVILFIYNLDDALLSLDKVKEELENEALVDEDIICKKSNYVCVILEYVLKIELCYHHNQDYLKTDYSDLRLGDLMKLVKPYIENSTYELLIQIASWSIQLLHESGKPKRRINAWSLCYMTTLYIHLLKSAMKTNPYPHFDE